MMKSSPKQRKERAKRINKKRLPTIGGNQEQSKESKARTIKKFESEAIKFHKSLRSRKN